MASVGATSAPGAAVRAPRPHLAWLVWGSAIALSSIALAGGVATVGVSGPFAAHGPTPWISAFAVIATYATVGLVLRVRRTDLPIGWIYLAGGLNLAIATVAYFYTRLGLGRPSEAWPVPPAAVASASAAFVVPTVTFLLTLLTLLFPTGRVSRPRWAPLIPVAAVLAVISGIALLLAAGPIVTFPAVPNPLALPGVAGDAARFVALSALALLVGCAALSAASLVDRYRDAESVERQQLKWFAYAGVVATCASVLYLLALPVTYAAASRLADVAWAVLMAADMLPPLATLVAIRRYGLYRIDTIIGRTVVYVALTAILAGLYAASVRLFQTLFVSLTGESSDAALVLTTLVLATSFTPIKQALERAVERRWKSAPGPNTASAGLPPESTAARDAELERRVAAIVQREVRRALAAERDRRR